MLTPIAGLCLTISPTLSLPSGTRQSDELEQRLDRLEQQLEARRETSKVPGMALAVVVGGEIVLARGFGWADLDKQRPVEAETLFAAGSTTKAFTAAAIAMLVDEGKLAWDDPITEYLPYFDLGIDSSDLDSEVTLRDLLSHRSGFGRMGLLWGGGSDVPSRRMLEVAAGAEPKGPFRQEFHYSNLMYLAAGQAAGQVAGDGWQKLVQGRILQPLGMDSSNLSRQLAQADARLATGYLWDAEKDTFEATPMLNIDRIGPAGSLNSNVVDLAKWVRWQLAQGELDGKRLLSEERFDEMWEAQIQVGGGMEYGLGWFLQDRDGVRVVEHGGNIDGFSAEVCLLPDHDMGFAMLFNASSTTLQQGCIGLFLGAMLGDLEAEEAVDSDVYAPYLGTYLADFGQFDGAPFEVVIQNELLAIDIPGQTIYELEAPDEDGRWVFAMTDQIALSFVRNEAGDVVALKMHQAGMTFNIPREGVEIEGLSEDQLQDKFAEYLGEYDANFGSFQNATFEVRVKGQQLAVDVPGQTLYALNEPGDDGRWVFSATEDIAVSFQREEGRGAIEALVMHQAGQDFHMPRRPSDSDLPSAAEVAELRNLPGRIKALQDLAGTRTTGKVWVPGSGLEGTFTQWTEGSERFATEIDFGEFGCVLSALSGDYAASYFSLRGLDVQEGRDLAQTRLGHPWTQEGDWSAFFDSTVVTGRDQFDGRDMLKVRLKTGELEVLQWIDAETGLVHKQVTEIEESGLTIPVTTTFSDYRGEGAVPLAHKVVISNPFTGDMEITVLEFESGLDIDDELFRLVEGEERLSK